MSMRTWTAVCALGVFLAPTHGFGFTVETFASEGCHESITREALAMAGWPRGESAPPPSEEDIALIGAVLFGGAEDRWELALLAGVRDNDFGAAGMGDLAELAAIHNGDANQALHCLRAPAEDGPTGDAQALEQCRTFILSELEKAQAAEQEIDLSATENVTMALAFQTAQVTLSRYAFHMGRALHALQDGFSHSFRSDDGYRVVTVFNYVDPALSGDYDPARDGPPHRSELDHCLDEMSLHRVSGATTASAALLDAMGGPGSPESRLVEARRVLDTWLSYESGCDAQNDWCGHVSPTASGCASAPSGSALPLVSLMTLTFFALGTRRKCLSRGLPAVAAGVLGLCAATASASEPNTQSGSGGRVATASTAQWNAALGAELGVGTGSTSPSNAPGGAELGAASGSAAESNGTGATVAIASTTQSKAPRGSGFGVATGSTAESNAPPGSGSGAAAGFTAQSNAPLGSGFGVATAQANVSLGSVRVTGGLTLDRAGAHVGLGVERAVTPTLRVGGEAEFNPWFELQSMTASPGVVNASGLLTVVWGRPSGWEIQSGIRLGGSVLLFTHPAARAGSLGLFFGASLIRVVVPIGPRQGLELSPDFALAIPSLGGVPFAYPQYRFSLGYRWDL
jgi:hypothetical protein